MNVFVLCTGRCGSLTFMKACTHIKNYTTAHESRTHFLGEERFQYPPNHIEVDNRLSWLLGRLEDAYGDRAFYVHLQREVTQTAASYAKRFDRGIMKAYRGQGIIMRLPDSADPLMVALDYCETVNKNIELFLRDKSKKMTFYLEHAKADFLKFCKYIGADVDMECALSEFDIRYNCSK